MNNSDYNDFEAWQNGDEDPNNPNNNPPNKFFYYGPVSDHFKKLWDHMNNQPKDQSMDELAEYLNMKDILNKNIENMKKDISKSNNPPKKQQPKKQSASIIISQDEYLKLIEIRGYLNITEQYAHVKALDKVLKCIQLTHDKKDIQ